MALLHIDGFDHQLNSTDLIANFGPFEWRYAAVTFVTGRYTGRAIRYGGRTFNIQGVLTTPISTAFFGVAVYMPLSTQFEIILVDSGTSTNQVDIVLDDTNGSIKIYRGGSGGTGTLLFTSGNNLFSSAAWFYLEVSPVIATSGSVAIHINGVSAVNATGINTQVSVNATFDTIILGSDANAINATDVTNDDFYICDSATGAGTNPFNTFVGSVRVQTLFPVTAGSLTQYTPLTSTNVSQIQETAMDSDTTYNFDSTVGHEDLFIVGPMTAGLTPLAVQVTGAYRQDSAGSRAVANHIKSGTVDTAGTSTILNATYTYQYDIYPEDPNITGAWTVSSVNAAEIGYATTA